MQRPAAHMIWITSVLLFLGSAVFLDRRSVPSEDPQASTVNAAGGNGKDFQRAEFDALQPSETSTRKYVTEPGSKDRATTSKANRQEKEKLGNRFSLRTFDALGHAAVENHAIEEASAPQVEATRREDPSSFTKESTGSGDEDGGLWIPVALLIRSVSSQSATVEWDGVEEGSGYNLYLCEDRTTHWSNCTSFDLATNRAELDGLNPDSRYRLDIVSVDGQGRQSETSDVLFIETLAPGADEIHIPAFETDEFLSINSACYNDCANTYATEANQGMFFDLAACSKNCEL